MRSWRNAAVQRSLDFIRKKVARPKSEIELEQRLDSKIEDLKKLVNKLQQEHEQLALQLSTINDRINELNSRFINYQLGQFMMHNLERSAEDLRNNKKGR